MSVAEPAARHDGGGPETQERGEGKLTFDAVQDCGDQGPQLLEQAGRAPALLQAGQEGPHGQGVAREPGAERGLWLSEAFLRIQPPHIGIYLGFL